MWTAFVIGLGAGIAATPHCLGMCGPFSLHLARSDGKGRTLVRLLAFVFGKTFTYVFLGTIAASLGAILFRTTALASLVPAMRLVVAIAIILIGLSMVGLKLPSMKCIKSSPEPGLFTSALGGLPARPGPAASLVLGLAVGFLPCPLPAGMLAVAAASHDLPSAIALMAGVGVGTAPGLVALGVFGAGIDRRFARVGMKLVGVVVVALGLMMLGRVTGLMPSAAHGQAPTCCGTHNK